MNCMTLFKLHINNGLLFMLIILVKNHGWILDIFHSFFEILACNFVLEMNRFGLILNEFS